MNFTANLSPDVYSHGMHLLCCKSEKKHPGYQKQIHAEMLRRNKDNLLDSYVSSRPPDYSNPDNTEARSLPGIGHEFWNNAKDHINAMDFPPYCFETNELIDESDAEASAKTLLQHVKTHWIIDNDALTWPIFEQAKIKLVKDHYILCVPVQSSWPSAFQDGQRICEDQFLTMFHGTRDIHIPNIMKTGLQSSPLSHNFVGAWVNSEITEALNWNCSLLDVIPGLALEVLCNKPEMRQNADIMQGNHHRHLQELKVGSSLPSLKIQSICMIIPNRQRIINRNEFIRACIETVDFLFQIPFNSQYLATKEITDYLQESLFKLTSHRIAYGGIGPAAYTLEFGFADKEEYTCISAISAHAAKLLWTLQRSSEKNRRDGLHQFDLDVLPRPIQIFFLNQFPSIIRFCHMTTHWHENGQQNPPIIQQEWSLSGTVRTLRPGITITNR